jgi:hypothetical protein
MKHESKIMNGNIARNRYKDRDRNDILEAESIGRNIIGRRIGHQEI